MTAYDKLKNINTLNAISENNFYQLIKDFQATYLEEQHYEERLQLHRNPIEVKNEILNELYSYLLQIQYREEMRDIDLDKKSVGYVPTKIIDIWKADKRLKSLFRSVKRYCELKSKDFNVIALHIAEYRAMNKMVSKIRRSIYKSETGKQVSQVKNEKAGKKIRVKIPKENKIRAELQKEIDSKCPFCDNTDVGHFEIHHIDEIPAHNEPGNLMLLCPICHSKITKEDISQAEVVNKKKELANKQIISTSDSKKVVNFNSTVNNAIVGHNNVIKITQTQKTTKQKYPPGCIGFDTVKANYVGHLINRYNEYKESEVGKGNVKYAVFASHLKKQFKIGATRTIYNLPTEKFHQLVQYIQLRIDDTKLAKIKGKNHKNYSTFDEYKMG